MDQTENSAGTAEEKLVRGIGKWDLVAVAINTIIGAGIFGLPSKAAAALGSYSILAFIVCAVIIALVVMCFAEVGSRFKGTGGPYLYTREAFGPFAGFQVGWLTMIARVATFAANTNLLVVYLGFVWPTATDSRIRVALITVVVVGLAVVNILGIRQSKYLTNVITFAKLIPLVGFAIIGLFFIRPENFSFGELPPYGTFGTAFILVIYAFVGFEVAVIPGGELRDPRKNLPFGLLTALAIVTAIYLLVQIVAIGTLPELATSERPLADAASRFIGPIGGAIIAVGAVLSILGNLNVGLIGSSRLVFAMGEDRALPNAFSWVNDRFRTPVFSTIVVSVLMFVLTVQSSFLSAVTLATITRLLGYATTCVALPVLRRRSGEAPFSLPLGPAIAVLAVLLLGGLLMYVDYSKEGLPILVAVVIGTLLYMLSRWTRRGRDADSADTA